ncbi:MAG: hypothetical protein ACRCX2_16410 [Paraclostridium sp.]
MGEQPYKRISMMMYGDENKLQEWNDTKNDPMPIKTMNNNGLQVLEEVPGEYKIYIDKDVIMTTVAKYAPGSYQTFMDRKADVDNSRSLLKGYKIEWTQKDDSDLFIQCNNEAISKIENQPMTLDEPTQPVVLEPKTVPTTYECCFRVGNDGVYVGEGYENLLSTRINNPISTSIEGYFVTSKTTATIDNPYRFSPLANKGVSAQEVYSAKYEVIKGFEWFDRIEFHNSGFNSGTKMRNESGYHSELCIKATDSGINLYVKQGAPAGVEIISKVSITKTSTPKPFVKSVMPSGKLDRITNANETTHTFLNKGDGVVTFGNGYFSLKGEKIQRLLVYKALLTEQEKQAELAKDIKLNMAYNDYFIGG